MCHCQLGTHSQESGGLNLSRGGSWGGGRLPLPVLEANKIGPGSSHGALPSPALRAGGTYGFWWDRKQELPPGAMDDPILPAFHL